jgi:anti-sigma B factor antagonist
VLAGNRQGGDALFSPSIRRNEAMNAARDQVRYLEIGQHDDALIVRFNKEHAHAIVDEKKIQELGGELYAVTDVVDRPVILDFSDVSYISSVFLGKLVHVDKTVTRCRQIVIICSMIPEIYEVFALTRMYRLFYWANTFAEALAKAGAHRRGENGRPFPTEDDIRTGAYYNFLNRERERFPGSALQDWLAAEQELRMLAVANGR